MKDLSRMLSLVALWVSLNSCMNNTASQQENLNITSEKIDTCNNPDANINCCFINMPSILTIEMKIADDGQEGERIILEGRLLKKGTSKPLSGIYLYAYQTDSKGYYSKDGTEKGFQKWHGKLHGWCKTDADGRYRISTIKPGRYPDNTMPAHIHCAIRIPEKNLTFYINDLVFKDDDLVTETYLSKLTLQGGNGVINLYLDKNEILLGKRDIYLDY